MYPVTLETSYFPAQTDAEIRETTVPSILVEAAERWRDDIALIEAFPDGTTGRRFSYAQLLAESARLALALASHFAPGERIAVWAPNSPEWVLLEYAAGMAGLILVTANPAYRPRELQYVLSQSKAAGLFLVREYRGNPMWEIASEAARELPGLRHIADIQDEAALFAHSGQRTELPHVAPRDPVQIQYTSGTTGFPKGAVLSHRGLTNNARLTFQRLNATPSDIYFNGMPLFHTAGCASGILGPIQSGARIVLLSQFDAQGAARLMEEQGITMAMGVPTMLIGMLEAYDAAPRDFSKLRVALSGGAMVPPELVRRIQRTFGCAFQIVYGQTETSPVLTQTRASDSFEDGTETAGQPLPQTEIAILDVTKNQPVPPGTVGEICARGYCNMIGYNDNPEATANTIDAQGWLHTGDLGTMDARGYVRITGRVKEMIIRGGENLFPAEIENVMLEHPAVAEAAVVGVPDPSWGEIAICFFRPAAGAQPTRADLVAHVRKALAAPKTPAKFIPLSGFPLTGSGKVQKFVLRERYIAGEFDGMELV